jgi:hypothetical protein
MIQRRARRTVAPDARPSPSGLVLLYVDTRGIRGVTHTKDTQLLVWISWNGLFLFRYRALFLSARFFSAGLFRRFLLCGYLFLHSIVLHFVNSSFPKLTYHNVPMIL